MVLCLKAWKSKSLPGISNQMKNFILVTGGAGFVGSNLIKYLLKKQKNIISLDDYSSGSKKITSLINLVNYLRGSTLKKLIL